MNKIISSMLFVFLINPTFAKISYHRSYDSQAVVMMGHTLVQEVVDLVVIMVV